MVIGTQYKTQINLYTKLNYNIQIQFSQLINAH